jgi:hypothetical protein
MNRMRSLAALLVLATATADPLWADRNVACLALLAEAAASEPAAAATRSLSYRGNVVDLGSGSERSFTFTVQGGERLLYVLHDGEGREISRWGFDRVDAWGHTAESGLVRLDEEGVLSWRVLAVVLAPNRFSALVREAVGCEFEGAAGSAAPVLRVELRGGATVWLTLVREPFRLVRMDRDARNGRRTTVLVGGNWIEGEPHLTALHALRDDVPHALYRFESVGYAPPQSAGFWAAPDGPSTGKPGAGP